MSLDNIPRCSWKLCRIQKLITGCDDQIRSANVLLPNGNEITRAICHLYPLELPSGHLTMMDNKGSKMTVTENDITKQIPDLTAHDKKRSKAHLIAQQQIHQCLRDNGASILFTLLGGCQDYW